MGYIHFFFLDDLIDESNKIKFYLPFDGFKTRPSFSDVNQYLLYKTKVVGFIKSRNKRIENYIKKWKMSITPAHNNCINSDWQFRCAPLPAGYVER
jgi:hypothetical protein